LEISYARRVKRVSCDSNGVRTAFVWRIVRRDSGCMIRRSLKTRARIRKTLTVEHCRAEVE
jgi:hypothetical protein